MCLFSSQKNCLQVWALLYLTEPSRRVDVTPKPHSAIDPDDLYYMQKCPLYSPSSALLAIYICQESWVEARRIALGERHVVSIPCKYVEEEDVEEFLFEGWN